MPPISEELLQELKLLYYKRNEPTWDLQVLFLDNYSISLQWKDAAGLVKTKFIMDSDGPKLLWRETH